MGSPVPSARGRQTCVLWAGGGICLLTSRCVVLWLTEAGLPGRGLAFSNARHLQDSLKTEPLGALRAPPSYRSLGRHTLNSPASHHVWGDTGLGRGVPEHPGPHGASPRTVLGRPAPAPCVDGPAAPWAC